MKKTIETISTTSLFYDHDWWLDDLKLVAIHCGDASTRHKIKPYHVLCSFHDKKTGEQIQKNIMNETKLKMG